MIELACLIIRFIEALFAIIYRTFKAIGIVTVLLFIVFSFFVSMYLVFTTYLKFANKSAFLAFFTLREGLNWIDAFVLFVLAICMGIMIFAITVYILEKFNVNISDKNLKFFGLFTSFLSLLIFSMFLFDSNQFSLLASVLSIIALASNLTKIKNSPIIKDDII